MIENTGTFCSNFAYYKSKVDRISRSLKLYKKSNGFLQAFLDQEIEIFLNDLDNLPNTIQECAKNMELGLQRRKQFLESKGLENEYQQFKISKL